MDNANYIVSKRCPTVVGTNCIEWQGGDIACLEICDGDMLTTAQVAIANKVCELVELTDATTIELPECLVTAWGTNDETVLNLIQFILDQLCLQQASIDGIVAQIPNIDPMVEIDFLCCSDNPCVKTGIVTVSVALQNIVNCLCDLKTTVTALSDYVGSNSTITDLSAVVKDLKDLVYGTTPTNGLTYLAANWQINRNIIGGATAFPIVVVP